MLLPSLSASLSNMTIDQNKTTASFELQDKIAECVRKKKWRELSATIDAYPGAKLDAIELDWLNNDTATKVSLLWVCTWKERWSIVKKLLKYNPKADIDGGIPKDGLLQGRSVLWLVVHDKRWMLANFIIDRYPYVNLDATGLYGLGAGINILLLAAMEGEWQLVDRILQLNPKINVHAISTGAEAENKGANVAFFAAVDGNFALLAKLIECSSPLDYNATLPNSKANTALWHTARAGEWELVGKLLQGNPRYVLSANALKGRPEGSALLKNSIEVNNVPVAFCSYLLGARASSCTFKQAEIIAGIKDELDALFDRVTLFRNGVGENHAANLFSLLPLELQNKCLLEVIKAHGPPKTAYLTIGSLPEYLLIQILDSKAKKKRSDYQRKAKACTATLAFQALRYSNGLTFHPFTKSGIRDFKNMLHQALDSYDIDYNYDMRQKIIAEIGKEQPFALTIKLSDIHAAIRTAAALR